LQPWQRADVRKSACTDLLCLWKLPRLIKSTLMSVPMARSDFGQVCGYTTNSTILQSSMTSTRRLHAEDEFRNVHRTVITKVGRKRMGSTAATVGVSAMERADLTLLKSDYTYPVDRFLYMTLMGNNSFGGLRFS
jgi:hypothetical protein